MSSTIVPIQSHPRFERSDSAKLGDEITETYMNNSANAGSTADRYQVIVHVGARLAGDNPRLDNGPFLLR